MTVRIGRLEIAFAVVLAVYIVLAMAGVTGAARAAGKLTLAVLGTWIAIRVSLAAVKQMLWRLRNRLIVAYFFIAVVPIILITLLAGLGVYLVGGQISIYLVTSELERRTTSLRGSVDFLAHNAGSSHANVAAFLEERYPGVQIVVQDGSVWSYPPDSVVPVAPADWPEGSGLMVRDGSVFGWARSASRGRTVMAVFPVTREYLGTLVPDIGEITILNLDTNHSLLHTSLANAAVPSRNRLLPSVNMLDFQIFWAMPIAPVRWESPASTESDWLNIFTRPSAVLRTVLSQKIDFATETIPMLFFGVALLFLMAEAVALIIGVSLTKTITGAVHELYEGTVRVMKGDLQHRIPIGGKDQLGELSLSFNQMTENMERLLIVEKERERLQAELEIAREVQNQLYPKGLPTLQTLRLMAVCNPARMVSGDYYDYQQIGSDRVAIVIGDVAGKGISAALLMATVQSSFRSQLRGSLERAAGDGQDASRAMVSTSHVVSHINQQLFADTAPEKYATFFLGIYDAATRSLTYTNAGHLPPILIRNGVPTPLEVNGMVVGAFPFATYAESRSELEPDDLLVFYTDGVTEPENAYGEMFGEDRMISLLVRHAKSEESRIVSSVTDAVRQWTGSDGLQDDMTLLLLRQL